jgi:hypothetical protein
MDQREAQQAVAQVLLEHIARDNYPSATQMNMLEQSLTPEMADDYLAVLLDKVRQDTWPSLDLLRRLQRLADTLPSAR